MLRHVLALTEKVGSLLAKEQQRRLDRFGTQMPEVVSGTSRRPAGYAV